MFEPAFQNDRGRRRIHGFARHATFALTARAGKLELLRGRLSPALFSEFADIAVRERLDATQIRVLSESGSPRLLLDGAPNPTVEQALRNVLGRYPVSQIRAGRLRAR